MGPTARQVHARRLTYLTPARLRVLERCASHVNAAAIVGDFIEAGIGLGGAAVLLATLKGRNRTFHGYDVFGMIPAPSDRDSRDAHARYEMIVAGRSRGIQGDPYYGYLPDLHERVARTFAEFGVPIDDDVRLHVGPFEETLHPPGPVALAHVDSDWHDAVQTCLRRLAPSLSPGGFIVVDDYNDYAGCRHATDGFLSDHRDEFELRRISGSVAIVRR